MPLTIADVRKAANPILKKYGVRRARLFGSIARGAPHANDVDILVSFTKPIDGWAYAAMGRELEEVLSRPVDLVTESALSEYIRPHIEADLTDIV